MQTNSQFLSQLIQLSQLRLKDRTRLLARAEPGYGNDAPGSGEIDWSFYQKQPSRYAYATAAKGYGYRMALMGFDFTDLEEKRRKFQWWLEQQGVDAYLAYMEATRLEHSWEFAAYEYCPTGDEAK